MSLDVTFTIEDIVEQLGKYKKQLIDTENAVQQIKGAIASCEHQMTLLVQKQNERVMKQAQSDTQDVECTSDKDQQQQEQVIL